MQFQLKTLGVFVACIAVGLAIGRQFGMIAVLLLVFYLGFVLPAFLPYFWLRSGVAFLMVACPLVIVVSRVHTIRNPSNVMNRDEFWFLILPAGIVFGLIAVGGTSLLRRSFLNVTKRRLKVKPTRALGSEEDPEF